MTGCVAAGLVLMMVVYLMKRSTDLHLNGNSCTSIEGTYFGVSGCPEGRYCGHENYCVSCPAVAGGVVLALDECDAIDGKGGCCSVAFLHNCPASLFDCSR